MSASLSHSLALEAELAADGNADGSAVGTIGAALRALSGISSDLLASYRALERRAERVEEELTRTNAELERKVHALDRVTRHLESILDALPTGVVVRDGRGVVERANPAALRILGLEPSALIGTAFAPAFEGEVRDGSARALRRADGELRFVASRRCPIKGEGKSERESSERDDGCVEILDERTELVALTERLHALDKLAALGHMAGGIAHELRNPMNAIKGFAALLARGLDAGTREHRWASLVVEGTGEADQILSSMLTLGRPEQLALETIDAAELAEDAVRAAQEGRAHPSLWSVATRASAPPFAGDRIKLRQALRNLIANAFDAQPRGGAVALEIEVAASELVFTVGDAGPGIAREVEARVLEPFFTTRAEGTGLGLALVNTIAQAHGGRVEISPRRAPLGGAEVALRIPFRAVP